MNLLMLYTIISPLNTLHYTVHIIADAILRTIMRIDERDLPGGG